MASFNKVVLMGNITRNPDVRTIPGSSTAVARTGLAVNRRYRDKEEVMFIDIVAYGRNAEIMGEYITKGSPILIDGRLSMNSWEQDGNKRIKHEVIIETLQMLSSRKDRDNYNSDYDSNFSRNDNHDDYGNTSSRNNNMESKDPYGNESINNNVKDSIDDDDIPF